MPFRIAKIFEIENGHLLTKHPDKCRFPHGHSRKVEIVLAANRLDERDMVCDFKALKLALKDLLDGWDHALALNSADPNFAFYQQTYGDRVIVFDRADPTSELMAKTIFDEATRRIAAATAEAKTPNVRYPIAPGVRVERVRVTETSSSWAEYFE